ncbi:MAG: PAS domain S-box-containing protein [Flavobacteriales bacterium]|jgi:PAS domain S-box-containing protein
MLESYLGFYLGRQALGLQQQKFLDWHLQSLVEESDFELKSIRQQTSALGLVFRTDLASGTRIHEIRSSVDGLNFVSRFNSNHQLVESSHSPIVKESDFFVLMEEAEKIQSNFNRNINIVTKIINLSPEWSSENDINYMVAIHTPYLSGRDGYEVFSFSLNNVIKRLLKRSDERLGAASYRNSVSELRDINHDNTLTNTFKDRSGHLILDIGLFSEDEPYRLSIEIPRAALAENASYSWQTKFILMFVLLLLIVVVLGYSIRTLVVSPLEEFRLGAENFLQGDLSFRVRLSRDDEFGRLASTFNAMSAEIEQAQLYFKRMIEIKTRQLSDSHAKIEAILDSVGDAIISIDDTGLIISFNSSAESMFGYSEAELIGKSINILIPNNIAKVHDEYLLKARLTGKRPILGAERTLEAVKRNGKERA